MLDWRLMGRGPNNPQIVARAGRGGVLTINRVVSTARPDQWWLTGPEYGLGTAHDSLSQAKAAAQRWADAGVRPDERALGPDRGSWGVGRP